MQILLADLHVHTVLSPCAEIEMIPPLIIKRGQELGLHMMAITDHNAAGNVMAVERAAKGSGITIIPGMELQTKEEVHLLCLFDTAEQALAWQEIVFAHLSARKNEPEFFGVQLLVDETGDLLGRNERLLLTSADLSIDEAVERVREMGGLPIAAHVDRRAYSLLANLGVVPEGLNVAALEISRQSAPEDFLGAHEELRGWPMIVSSDAHRLSELSANMRFRLREPSVHEIELALEQREGRRAEVLA
ncbi:MAG: PHP domain-containing protein [Anaerolineales bacterium]